MFTNPDVLASRVAQHVGELHADAAVARQLRAAARARTAGAALTSTHDERVGHMQRLRRLVGVAAAPDARVQSRVARGVPGRGALPTR